MRDKITINAGGDVNFTKDQATGRIGKNITETGENHRRAPAQYVVSGGPCCRTDGVPLDLFLWETKGLMPVIYWMGRSVPGEYAKPFFAALQRFFVGSPLCFEDIDGDLKIGTDHLLRVLSTGKVNDGYGMEKLAIAYDRFMTFVSEKEQDRERNHKEDAARTPIRDLLLLPRLNLERVLKNAEDMAPETGSLIRFVISLLIYFSGHLQQISRNSYPPVPEIVTNELRTLLAALFYRAFGVVFPDPLAAGDHNDIRETCRSEWERFFKASVAPAKRLSAETRRLFRSARE